jgi:hypothetical protein
MRPGPTHIPGARACIKCQAPFPERISERRTCTKCLRDLPMSAFSVRCRNNFRLHVDQRCRPCRAHRPNQWWKRNRERHRATGQSWRERNRDKMRSYARKYYRADPEKDHARHRAYRKKNRKQVSLYEKLYYRRNKEQYEKMRARQRLRRKRPEVAAAIRTTTQMRRAQLRAVRVERVADAIVFRRDDYICWLCACRCDPLASSRAGRPSIDHVIPISKGGEHSYENIRTAHVGCNSGKRDRIVGG